MRRRARPRRPTMIVQAGRFIPYTAPSTGARAHAGGYAAHFVEVHVDPDLGTIRVARVVSAIDGGRILNPKTARSQIIGGIAMGIGMALLEETVSDRTGRLVTTSLAEYVVAVNADVRDVDVLFVGQPDSMTPLGTKGVGELAITGMAAAIANAVYHATGTRVCSLPISIEKVLGHESAARTARLQRRSIDVNHNDCEQHNGPNPVPPRGETRGTRIAASAADPDVPCCFSSTSPGRSTTGIPRSRIHSPQGERSSCSIAQA